MKNHLNDIIQNDNRYLETKYFNSRSDYYKLKNLLEEGKIEYVKRGLYRRIDIDRNDELSDVCQIISGGILCLYTAWDYYELTTFKSSRYFIAIPSKAKRVVPDYPPIELIYRNEISYHLGKSVIEDQTGRILIYDIEKSVCDAIKYRNKAGAELAAEILKNYLNKKERNIDKLLDYSRQLRIEKILQQQLKFLL